MSGKPKKGATTKKSAVRLAAKPAPKGKAAAKAKRRTPAAPEPVAAPRKRKPRANAMGGSVASESARDVAIAIAVAALEKKAVNLEVVDVSGRVDYADFLVLMSGRSERQVAALASGIEEALRKQKKAPLAVEGMPNAVWVLLDFGDVVVHVFQEEARELYDLDSLWADAKRLPIAHEGEE